MRLYRLLLNLYPARFREEYAGPLQQQFRDEYREAETVGARLRLWLSALRDLAWSIPVELVRELRQDLSHSLRVHARRPFVMTFTVAILALAIGGATGVFSVVNAVLIKSLPFRDPERLIVLANFGGKMSQNRAMFHDWRTSSAYLEDAAGFVVTDMTVGGASAPTRVGVTETSSNFFSLLGAEPLIGRAFAPSEDLAGNDGVAVISYSLWQQFFGGDPRALGSKILLNGTPMTVIGVARPGFNYPAKASIWTPTVFGAGLPKVGVFYWQAIGRRKSDLSFSQTEQMFDADAQRINPGSLNTNLANRPHLIPLQDKLAENVRQASLVLMAAIGFVLLIACANVANLLLTRTTERRGELVIRAALGASRARLVQQLISESVLLSFIAAAAGLGIAYWATKFAALVQPAELAAQVYTILDWRVLGFTIVISILTGVLFGVVPAWMVRHLQPSGDLVRMLGAGPRTAKLRGVLVAMQVALTLVLLAGSVTMGRSFLRLLNADLGFRTDHLVTVSITLAGNGNNPDQEIHNREFGRQALERLRSVPGVESAAAIDFLPLEAQVFMGGRLITESGRETSIAIHGKVTADYFRTMGTQIVYGREFLLSDAASDNMHAIVTEGIAREVADGSAAIGRTLTQKRFDGKPAKVFTIIGVVRPVHYRGPQGPATEQIFFPADRYFPNFATFIARVRGNPEDSLVACRDAVQSVNREIPVYGVKTYQQRLDETLAIPRFRATVFLFFGGFALLLAVAGIYGVSSYSITQRRREIGVRIAIGASAQGVRAMILRQALWPIAAGMLIGLGGAAWQGRLLEHLLASAPRVDIAACAASAVVLAAVALVSIWTATGRVLELNPIEVLKAE